MPVSHSPVGSPRATRSGTTEVATREVADSAAQAAEAALRDNADTLAATSVGDGQGLARASRDLDTALPPLSEEHTEMRRRRKQLTAFLLNDKKKFSKPDALMVLEIFNNLEIEYVRMCWEMRHYKGKVEAYKRERTQPHSYASATKSDQEARGSRGRRERSTSARRVPGKNRNTVIIRPLDKDSQETSQQVKDKLIKEVDMGKSGIKVKGVRKTKSAAVIVKVATEQDAEKFRQEPKMKTLKFEVVKPRKRRPRMILLNVD